MGWPPAVGAEPPPGAALRSCEKKSEGEKVLLRRETKAKGGREGGRANRRVNATWATVLNAVRASIVILRQG